LGLQCSATRGLRTYEVAGVSNDWLKFKLEQQQYSVEADRSVGAIFTDH
jgi:hypothetical protein